MNPINHTTFFIHNIFFHFGEVMCPFSYCMLSIIKESEILYVYVGPFVQGSCPSGSGMSICKFRIFLKLFATKNIDIQALGARKTRGLCARARFCS